ncbi:hypothetical protein NDU88_005562 [Pleurodeles waltl]|uniref:Uncharacterized protein n=1 Tax=Pleurodeles waltl TaxID=8319 RepID=A0AAV7QGB6_PLEWA|nr:hypothetical protein NDU88_005562 [Pleurodeles waltl]
MGPRVIPRPSDPLRSAWRSRRAEARPTAQAAFCAAPRLRPCYGAEASSPRESSKPWCRGHLTVRGSLQASPPPRAARHCAGSRRRSASGHVLALRHPGHAPILLLL